MARIDLGLKTAFYLYPCGLFATLLLSQLVRYRYARVDNAASVDDEKRVQKVERFYAKLIWSFQLLLPPLFVCFSTQTQ
jgi:hypothetical protein